MILVFKDTKKATFSDGFLKLKQGLLETRIWKQDSGLSHH
jgi:hypothetical protein